jgi:flavodoxin
MTDTNEKQYKVYLLDSKYWGMIFIPEDEFHNLFEIGKNNVASFKSDIEDTGYWNKDTYIQSYNLCHARSGIRYGIHTDPYVILGIFQLDDTSV